MNINKKKETIKDSNNLNEEKNVIKDIFEKEFITAKTFLKLREKDGRYLFVKLFFEKFEKIVLTINIYVSQKENYKIILNNNEEIVKFNCFFTLIFNYFLKLKLRFQ